jgi:hypothetical protein
MRLLVLSALLVSAFADETSLKSALEDVKSKLARLEVHASDRNGGIAAGRVLIVNSLLDKVSAAQLPGYKDELTNRIPPLILLIIGTLDAVKVSDQKHLDDFNKEEFADKCYVHAGAGNNLTADQTLYGVLAGHKTNYQNCRNTLFTTHYKNMAEKCSDFFDHADDVECCRQHGLQVPDTSCGTCSSGDDWVKACEQSENVNLDQTTAKNWLDHLNTYKADNEGAVVTAKKVWGDKASDCKGAYGTWVIEDGHCDSNQSAFTGAHCSWVLHRSIRCNLEERCYDAGVTKWKGESLAPTGSYHTRNDNRLEDVGVLKFLDCVVKWIGNTANDAKAITEMMLSCSPQFEATQWQSAHGVTFPNPPTNTACDRSCAALELPTDCANNSWNNFEYVSTTFNDHSPDVTEFYHLSAETTSSCSPPADYDCVSCGDY